MIPAVGQRFGPYELLGKLGSGGMAHVFRAWDQRLHREVAIKLLNDEYPMPGMRERFLREARAASALNHPNICTIFDIGEQDGEPYLVMELLEGETLKDQIRRGPMPVAQAVAHGQEIAQALRAAHARGIVHRDIKPANIFLVDKASGFPQVKVLDFGLAQVDAEVEEEPTRPGDLTTLGATVGTVAYMSPEQARGEAMDGRSDLFALGAVMYEMATGEIPFQGATSAMVFVQLLEHAPAPPRSWNASIPVDLEEVIQRLLLKDRRARYQTALEVCQALHGVVLGRSGAMPDMVPGAAHRGSEDTPENDAAGARERSPAEQPAEKKSKEAREVGTGDLPGMSAATVPESVLSVTSLAPQPRPRSGLGAGAEPVPRPKPISRSRDWIRPLVPAEMPGVIAEIGASEAQRASARRAGSGETLINASSGSHLRAADSAGPEDPPRSENGGALRESVDPAPAPAKEPQIESPPRQEDSTESAGEAAPEAIVVPEAGGQGSIAAERLGGSIVMLEAAGDDAPIREATNREAAGRSRTRGRGDSGGLASRRAGEATTLALRRKQKRKGRLWVEVGALGLITALGAVIGMKGRHLRPAIDRAKNIVLLTTIENRTGDASLDETVMQGLEIDVDQSTFVTVMGSAAFRSELRQRGIAADTPRTPELAQKVAKALGAKTYVYGEIRGSGSGSGGGAPFSIRVDLLDTRTREKIGGVEDLAASRDQLGDTIDRLADSLRSEMGEDNELVMRASLPLRREATANVDALHAYALAEQAQEQGHPFEAISAYQRAIVAEPRFVQAHLQLAEVYREQGAEVAAANEAKLAQSVVGDGGERLKQLVGLSFLVNSDGDLKKAEAAARDLLTLNPNDAKASLVLAIALRGEGHLVEALQAAQQAYADDPRMAEAYVEAELALVAMDRYAAALEVRSQAERLGAGREGATLLAAYLANRRDLLEAQRRREDVQGGTAGTTGEYALSLDDGGEFGEGAQAWKAAAKDHAGVAGLGSADASMRAVEALDRALAGECSMTQEQVGGSGSEGQGPEALYRGGLAAALCGESEAAQKMTAALAGSFPRNTAVASYMVPDLKAAIAIGAGRPSEALEDLEQARASDVTSLTPYLRGLAHLEGKQGELAGTDFEVVLAHRGAALVGGSAIYPMAQIGLARALAIMGDHRRSAEAYRRFLAQWALADRGSPLLLEAETESR